MQTTLLIILAVIAILALWTQLAVASALRRHSPTGIFVPVTGGRLHLRDLGPRDAPPERTIVLLHGASCNLLALTLPLADKLTQNFRVIAIDRPGHGHSERPGGRAAASLALQARLIVEAMGAVGAPKALVVAHSWSGALAATLALDHPERVLGMGLLAPATHPWPGGIVWYYHAGSWPVIGWIFARLLPVPGAALTMQAGVDSVFHPQKPPANYVEETAVALLLRPGSFAANAEDVAGLYDQVSVNAGRYHKIAAPAFVIAGDSDGVVAAWLHLAALARDLPDVETHVLKGVGHVPHHADTAFVVSQIERLSARAASRQGQGIAVP
ncbi:MAG: alpha/beta hydrolase [Methylocystis sp.]|nr:alpha/beta hydrolase [Methylocystis sp.]MCA3583148.1 alpha/beta hydrolase [Methylocystis sp.]MCA3587647.1 alpha/beta hydrolase [Methylocystis sp.]MCA3590774.1 alpha/beta hydrolase [Methylocystis sp.]